MQKDQVPYWQLQVRDLETLFNSPSKSCGSAMFPFQATPLLLYIHTIISMDIDLHLWSHKKSGCCHPHCSPYIRNIS